MKRLLFLACAAVLSGCTAHVQLSYRPDAPASPLPGAQSIRMFVAPVYDRSGGVKLDGDIVKYTFVHPRPLAENVHEALVVELKRLGYPIVSSAGEANKTLSSALAAVGLHVQVEGASAITTAVVTIDLKAGELGGSLTGRAQTKRFGGCDPTQFEPLLNRALADAMAKLGPGIAASRKNAPQPAPPAPGVEPPPTAAAERSDVEDLPHAGPARRGHAVIIGIERYREGLPKADFAAADARLVAGYAKRVLGYPEQNVALLVDERATRGDFEKYFERWLPNRVEKGDEVFVYFSGHGAPNPKTGDSYAVPYDGDATYIEQTGYPLKKLYAQLAKLPAKRVIVAVDSCFSGAGGRSVIAKGARPLVLVKSADVPEGMVVLSAAAGDEISNGYNDKGHGLFTYFLLKGLKEKGVDLPAVFDYLKPEVARVARREYNADQTPQWRGAR